MFGTSHIQSADDARRAARRRLPWMVFDYIDGAAGEETGAQDTRAALRDTRLVPRSLRNVTRRDLGVEIFGQRAGLPFGISPMGMCNLSRPGADLMLARAAARHSIPLGVSTVASTPMEQMIEVAQGHAWFQLYYSGDGSGTIKLVERARTAGYQTLILTVDVPEVGRRPRELRHGFKMPFRIGPRQFLDFALHPVWSLETLAKGQPQLANFDGKTYRFDRTESRAGADWDFLARLRNLWPGKLVIKGVLDEQDAVQMRDAGVDALQVSSHGGRQLDSAILSIHALSRIRAAVGPQMPVFYDSGLRSGEDVVKAFAMGADFAFLGRLFQFAIAAGGEAGLEQILSILSTDISSAMAQLGACDMASIGVHNLAPAQGCGQGRRG